MKMQSGGIPPTLPTQATHTPQELNEPSKVRAIKTYRTSAPFPSSLGNNQKRRILNDFNRERKEAQFNANLALFRSGPIEGNEIIRVILGMLAQNQKLEKSPLPRDAPKLEKFVTLDASGYSFSLEQCEQEQRSRIRDKYPDMKDEEVSSLQKKINWNERVDFGSNMLGWLARISSHAGVCFAYEDNGRPVGIVNVNLRTKVPEVEGIVVLPRVRFAAKTLMEQAVQLSVKSGHLGKLVLKAGTAEGIEFFKKCGFKVTDVIDDAENGQYVVMSLDPQNNPAWQKREERWMLAAHADKK